MSLPFLTQPNAGHPKARWHTIIEPPLATALTTAFQRFHTAFRAFDKSNAGYVPRGSILSMCAAAKLELGSGLQEFLDVESVRACAMWVVCQIHVRLSPTRHSG